MASLADQGNTATVADLLQSEADEVLAEVWQKFPHYRDHLQGTSIRISGRLTSSAGNACPKRKQIGLSLPIFSLEENRGEFRNTVLHELAHVIAGPAVRAHGVEWRRIFLELGGNGKRTHQMRAKGRHHRHTVHCEKCHDPIEVGTRMRNSIAKGRRDYLHVGCGGVLTCPTEAPVESAESSDREEESSSWISDLSKKIQQGTLFRFFGGS